LSSLMLFTPATFKNSSAAFMSPAFNDELFEPPFSTFEITKKEANVENINTIPGSDVFYMDMRILPDENLDDILRIIDEIRTYFEYEYKVRIQLEIIQRSDAPAPTDPEHPW